MVKEDNVFYNNEGIIKSNGVRNEKKKIVRFDGNGRIDKEEEVKEDDRCSNTRKYRTNS